MIALSVAAVVAFLWWALARSYRAGRTAVDAEQSRNVLDQVDAAQAARRDAASDPDPVQRLRDEWSRD